MIQLKALFCPKITCFIMSSGSMYFVHDPGMLALGLQTYQSRNFMPNQHLVTDSFIKNVSEA